MPIRSPKKRNPQTPRQLAGTVSKRATGRVRRKTPDGVQATKAISQVAQQTVVSVAPVPVPFQYTDVRPTYDNTDYYECTNEQLPQLRTLTDRVNPEVVGAIASGGEVPLAVMLLQPDIRTCVAVDQAYGSLKWAYLKAMTIHLCTPEEAHKLLTQPNTAYSYSATYPKELCDKIEQATPAALKTTCRPAGPNYWKLYTSIEDIGRIKANLTKLHLVHGDIRDLPQFSPEPYDLIYLSNARSKSNYAKSLALENFEPMLRRRGSILTTGGDHPSSDDHKWKNVIEMGYDNTTGIGSSWNYNLLQYQGVDTRTYQRQAWERIRDLTNSRQTKISYRQPDLLKHHCSSCRVTRTFDVYHSSPYMYCQFCSWSCIKPTIAKTSTRLYERYPIKLAV